MKSNFFFFLIPCFFFFSGFNAHSDSNSFDWVLKKKKGDIKVYTRDIIDSNLKELKITMSFKKIEMSAIIKKLKESNLYKDWMFKCTESKLVKKISDTEMISYYKFDFPWPLNDRDTYMKSVIEKNPSQKKVTIKTTALKSYDDLLEDVVRIESHFNQWEFEQVSEDIINLTYYLKTDPAGNIPDWMVNLAIDKGPTSSLTNLRALIQN